MEEEVIVRNPTRELRALFLHMSYTLYSALFALRCLLSPAPSRHNPVQRVPCFCYARLPLSLYPFSLKLA